MLDWLKIENYRGIARGEIRDFARINVLVGPNNSGKSSLLEALLIAGAGGEFSAVSRAVTHRGWAGIASVDACFRSETSFTAGSGDQRLLVTVQRTGAASLAVEGPGSNAMINLTDAGLQQAHQRRLVSRQAPAFIDLQSEIDESALGRAVSLADLKGQRRALIEILKPLLPSLTDLRFLNPGDRYTLYVDDQSSSPWPAIVAGDGFKRLLVLASGIAADISGTVLVEEPEAFLHVGALGQVAKLFWEAALSETSPKQIFATTHSLELIDAIFGSPQAPLAQAAVYRLSLRDGHLAVVRVPGDKVRELREEIGEDLRR